MPRPRVLLAWSSGKDSAWTLHRLRAEAVEVVALLTTLNAALDRVAVHGVRRELLERQSRAAGLPLLTVPLPWPCANAEYEAALLRALAGAGATLGATHVAFGDLYLEDIRAYREALLVGTGFTPLFPLWGSRVPSGRGPLAREMIGAGLQAVLTCVDPSRLSPSFAGRAFDSRLLDELPEGVDPCGEGGEFHTFAWDGPMFAHPIEPVLGEIVERDGFVFADLL
jgi:uncharacterized protein (TIGR00290 family)